MMRDLITNPTFAESITLVRQMPGRRNDNPDHPDGYKLDDFIPGPTEEVSLKAVTSPLTEEGLRMLPEATGARLEDFRMFYIPVITARPLRVGRDAQTPGDIIVYEGLRWGINSVERWPKFGFSVLVAERMAGQEG